MWDYSHPKMKRFMKPMDPALPSERKVCLGYDVTQASQTAMDRGKK